MKKNKEILLLENKKEKKRDDKKELEFEEYTKNTKRSQMFKNFPMIKEGVGYMVYTHQYPFDAIVDDHIIIAFENVPIMYSGYASDIFMVIKTYIGQGYCLTEDKEENDKAKGMIHWHLIKYK